MSLERPQGVYLASVGAFHPERPFKTVNWNLSGLSMWIAPTKVFLSNVIDGSYCTWNFIKTFIHFIMSFLRVDMSSFCQAFLSVCEVCLDLWQAYERMTVKIKDIKAWSKMLSPYLPTLQMFTGIYRDSVGKSPHSDFHVKIVRILTLQGF